MKTIYQLLALGLSAIILTACQTTPRYSTQTAQLPQQPADVQTEPEQPATKVQVIPYPEQEIISESQPLPEAPQPANPPRIILPEPTTSTAPKLRDGRGIAAYDKLMQDYISHLRGNDLAAAESDLIHAQRIAPQSADVYRELSRIANLKKQGSSAEAFARKGLTFAQTDVQRKQLWQQILQSAQMRNNVILMKQAQQQLTNF